MAEPSFEAALERLFAEAPTFADAPLFAARVESRLDRAWNARNLLIGGLGLGGGVIGGAQVLGSGLAERLSSLTHHSREVVQARLADFAGSLLLPGGVAISPQLAAMSLALVAVAAGLGMMRILREI